MIESSLISVVIPFYKGEKYIQQAIDSVLNQLYKDIEILLINDGSPKTKESENLIKNDKRIKYFYKNNEGIGATRNYGIMKASGQYIAFLDQDDIWVKDFLTDDIKTIKTVKHMICVYAIEAVEMLYRTGITEEKAEPIINEYFCHDFLDNYKQIVLSDNRKKEIGEYYEHRESFIRNQYKIGKREYIKAHLKKFNVFRMINDRKKYSICIPKNYI